MILVAIASLALMFGLNVTYRGPLYPASLFTGTWLAAVLGITATGDVFYAVSPATLTVYVAGAFAFSVGAFVSESTARGAAARVALPRNGARSRAVLDIALAILVVGLPFYLRAAAGTRDWLDPMFLALQRAEAVEAMESSDRSFSLLANLVYLSMFVAFAMVYEYDGTRRRGWRVVVAVALALIYGAAKGTKGNAVLLLVTLAFVDALRKGRINYRVMAITAVVSVVMFGVGFVVVNNMYLGLGMSWDAIVLAGRGILVYWLGGPVAFDRVVANPNAIEAVQNLDRFFLETANGLGAHFNIPSVNAEYSLIGPSLDTNVYTIYYSYFPQFGMLGVVVGMLLTGAVLAWFFRRARARGPVAVIVAGSMATGLLLSFHSERFILALNMYMKMALFLAFTYSVWPRIRFKRTDSANA